MAGKKVLLVEDTASMRAFITSALEAAFPVEVTEAENGFVALKVLPEGRFDLILTDINMPDINGLELIHFLRNHPLYKKVPIVIISTESSKEDRQKGLELGADAYLVKPFSEEKLSEVLAPFMETA